MVGGRSENKERNGKMASVSMKSVWCQPAGAGDRGQAAIPDTQELHPPPQVPAP